ncbi:hypothetical protein STAQ_42610 [Allostella sp. ATCC 35155]|nr:hypothetical protein STAQ_42610 [Stella sp. ATCC 35155]
MAGQRHARADVVIARIAQMRFVHGTPTRPAAAGFLLAPLLGGCAGPLSALDPAGPGAAAIALLWWGMLVGAALILLGVLLLLAHALRPRAAPRRVSERLMLGGAGVLFPLVTLTVLLVFALRTGEALLPHRSAGDRPLVVEARGQQWWWEFVYPDFAGAPLYTAGTLHIPAGRPVDVHLSSRDVIHGFWVPRLAGKLDAIPGHRTVLRLQADQAGTYAGACAEFCGLEHTRMTFTIVAHDPADFAERLTALAAPPPAAEPEVAAAFAAGCGACHSTDARTRSGAGPNLAGIGRRLPGDLPALLARHPVPRPGHRMPDHAVPDAAMLARIAAYLEELR